MKTIVRGGTLEDLPQIATLHRECFADPWDEEYLGRLLAQPGAFSVVAMEDGATAGFVLARSNAGETEILSLGVRPSSRRRSLGLALVQNTLDRASEAGAAEVFLEVSVENNAARGLYRRLGFREVGSRSAYYFQSSGPAADALILCRSLSG